MQQTQQQQQRQQKDYIHFNVDTINGIPQLNQHTKEPQNEQKKEKETKQREKTKQDNETIRNKTNTETKIAKGTTEPKPQVENKINNTKTINSIETPKTKNPPINKTPPNIPKQQNVQPVIVDNVISTLSKEQLDKALHHIFKEINFKTVHLDKGGIAITPTATIDLTRHTNKLLNENNYPSNIFGEHLYIHLTDQKDLRPWLCINQIDRETPISEIATKLTENNISYEGLHRKIINKQATTLVLFKTKDQIQHNLIINKKININNKVTTIRKHINITTIRCTNCQQLGHMRRLCHNKRRCPRCASFDCPPKNCLRGTIRRYVNCDGEHSSAYKNCKYLKANIRGMFEYEKQQSNTQHISNKQNTLQEQQNTQNIQIQQLNNKQNTVTNMEQTITELKNKMKETTETNKQLLEEQKVHKKLMNTNEQIFINLNKDIIQLQNETKNIRDQTNIQMPNNNVNDYTEETNKGIQSQLNQITTENEKLKTQINENQKQITEQQNMITKLQEENKNKYISKQILQETEDITEHTNKTITQILKDITIPLIAQTIIHHQTIEKPKVLLRRIMETLSGLLDSNPHIPLNIKEINLNLTNSTDSDSQDD